MKWQSLKISAFPTSVLTQYQECKIGVQKGTLILCIDMIWSWGFLSRVVNGRNVGPTPEPEPKRQCLEWRHTESPKKKKFWRIPSAENIMAALFWDEVVLLFLWVYWTNCDQSHEALRSLNACFRLVLFTREISETLFLNDNTRPHSNMSKTEDIVPARCMKSCSRTTLYSSVRSFERQHARTTSHSWCGTAERHSPMAAAKGRRLCRAGIHTFAQRLKKDFSADGGHIEI